jgi:F0F1-type ATP synthase assembly protein I
MAENDEPKHLEDRLEDEDMSLPTVPTHHPLPLPPEVHYTRPTLGKKSSSQSGFYPQSSEGWSEPVQAANHGAGLAAGLTFVTSIVAGALLGNWIDQRWDRHSVMPWATLLLTLIGAVVGFVNLQRLTARANRNNKKP